MPNGGSDCCATCWFNRKNAGKSGLPPTFVPGPGFCEIRDAEIPRPGYTYCANHPHKSPEGDRLPIGPILSDLGRGREIWKPFQDSEAIRQHLLALLAMIGEQPQVEYHSYPYRDEVVVWQLGEFREKRAENDLKRVLAFNPDATTGEPLHRTRHPLLQNARVALAKIAEGGIAPPADFVTR